MPVLAITDELQSLQLDSKSAFADDPFAQAQSTVAAKLGSAASFRPDGGSIAASFDRVAQASPSASAIPQPPLAVAELQTRVTGRLEPLSRLNVDTLAAAIPAAPGADVFKGLNITASVNQTVSGLGSAITGNDNFGQLNVSGSGAPILAEFDEFLRGAQAFPARLLDALLTVFKNLLDRLAHPEQWLDSLGTEALTEIFVEQIRGVTASLPPVAIRLGGEAIQTRGDQAIALSSLLTELELAQLDRTTIRDLRHRVNGMVARLDDCDRTLAQSQARVKAFNLEEFKALLDSLPQGKGGQIDALANLFGQAETFVSDLGTRMEAVTAQIQALIDQVRAFIEQAMAKVGEVANQVVAAIETQLATAQRALEQVRSYLDQAIQTIRGFVDQACQQVQAIVKPVKQAFNQVATTAVSGIETLSKTVTEQVTTLDRSIKDVRSTLATELNQAELERKIRDLLGKVTQLLQGPEVESAIDTANQGIDQMIVALEKVSLKPPFETAVTKTKTLESDLRGMNVATMGTAQKAALKVGVKILQQVDVPGVVNPELTAAFDDVLNPVVNIVNRVQAEVNQVTDQVKTFQPGTLLEEFLRPYIDTFVAQLNDYRPSKLLQPVKDLYQDLLNKLTVLDPEQLLTLLENLYQTLLGVLKALSPQGLTEFLKAQLQKITDVLDNLPVKELVNRITAALIDVEKLFAGLGLDEVLNAKFWRTLADVLSLNLQQQIGQLNTVKAEITRRVGQVSDDTLAAELMRLRSAIATFAESPAADYQTAQDALTTAWDSHQRSLAALATPWQTAMSALDAFTPGPEFQLDYADLKERLVALHQRLTQAEVPYTALHDAAALGAGSSQSSDAKRLRPTKKLLQEIDILAAIATRDDAQIIAAFKQVIPQELDDQLIGPVRRILTRLDTMLAQPRKILSGIEAVIKDLIGLPAKLTTLMTDLAFDIGDQIRRGIAMLSSALKGFNVDFLNDLHRQIVDQMAALRPAYLLNAFYDLSDFENGSLSTLLTRLRSPSPDPVSRLWLDRLSESQRNLLLASDGPQTQTIVIQTFNQLLDDPNLYSTERFQGITLTPAATGLLARRAALEPSERLRLNRLLLEAAYPKALVLSMQSLFPFFLATLEKLYPDSLIQSLDALHQEILQVVRDLPTTLAKALNAEYDEVMKVFKRVIQDPIAKIFAALIARLRGLQSELGIGLEDISSAYNRLLAAVPV
ncbi:hypothetical protein IQ265_15210 [Nodosilinea sp. LEGE 06152]|uniref:hypothetical protein n=1 Tax=Nodosilinea sp. LEGE 06152 TaxID=2777966 RepID=UPI001880DC74|nr:hypothetical protein [Nodosilinea sp. LEGE 06152]MBE9158166.1 hypothetical protein [Nodosilinea sp. LEGE 06152]